MKTRVLLAMLAWALPGAAQAQVGVGPLTPVMPERPALPEPTIPSEVRSPADLPPGTIPGGAEGEGGVTVSPPPPTGYDGGDYITMDSDPRLWGGVRSKRKVPAYHLVVKGDTLWELCDKYYADPWAWPQLWAYNKSITNPHWIYPGDRVRLLGAADTSSSDRGGEEVRLSSVSTQGPGAVSFRQTAFADPKELEESGKITASKEEKLLLAQYDEIYLDPEQSFKPQVGKAYSIYRVRKKLKNSKGDHVGYLVEVRGTARVKRAPEGELVTAEITESYNPIERNDRLGPLRLKYRRLPVVRADKDVEAHVIATLADKKMHALDDVVFIDAGKSHGVVDGHRFLAANRGDGYHRVEKVDDPDDEKWPKEAIAEISVIDARDNVSVGLITRSLKEIEVGKRVDLRKGY